MYHGDAGALYLLGIVWQRLNTDAVGYRLTALLCGQIGESMYPILPAGSIRRRHGIGIILGPICVQSHLDTVRPGAQGILIVRPGHGRGIIPCILFSAGSIMG